jgi:hypothetical protein
MRHPPKYNRVFFASSAKPTDRRELGEANKYAELFMLTFLDLLRNILAKNLLLP